MRAIHIDSLFIYPVKSLKGFAVDSAIATPLGFQWDRHWMLINEDGLFLTQRKLPQMVLIHTALSTSHLVLSKQGMPDCLIPFDYPLSNTARTAKIWKDTCDVIFEEQSVNQWLQKALNITQPVFLVRMKTATQRTQSKAHLLGDETRTLFADAAPFLVTTTASLTALNQQLSHNGHQLVTMENFRPNIVLEGVDSFREHSIKALEHDDYQLQHCYPCQRCIMITVDVNDGSLHPTQEPFITLSQFNTMPDNPKAPAFGENAILLSGNGQTISTGDQLRVSLRDF